MKTIRFLLVLAALTAMFPLLLKSQFPPCDPGLKAQTFSVDTLQNIPPYSLNMPYDVLLGYIALDSVCNYASRAAYKEFLSRQNYNDTLRYIMRYYYKVVDYDPIIFKQYLYQADIDSINPANVRSDISKLIAHSPTPFIHKMLLNSFYIAHVRISDTIRTVDTNAMTCKNGIIVTAEVLDLIKGQRLPNCTDYNYPYKYNEKSDRNDKASAYPSLPDPCLQFYYCLEWHRGVNPDDRVNMNDLKAVDSHGNPWVKKDKEYIVFLNLIFNCRHQGKYYLSAFPSTSVSETLSMYPIENGMVQDPGNEFGLGTSVPLATFKNALNSLINEIVTYEVEKKN
ncbi:MAG: hypothetical protein ACLFQX_06365 [Candidatus Kapaibacterium sp.]